MMISWLLSPSKGTEPGQHLAQHHSQSVDIDFLAIHPFADFRGHVMEGPNALGLATAAAAGDVLREAIVADLDRALVSEDVPPASSHDG